MKSWKRKEETVEIVVQENPKLNKKNSKQPNRDFKKGGNYVPNKEDITMGSNFGKANPSIPDITIGKNESLETRLEKKNLREKAAKVNYAVIKEEEEGSLNEIQKKKIACSVIGGAE